MNKKIQYIAILGLLMLSSSQLVQAQLKEEVLILQREREPEVQKIQKKKTSVPLVKNYPPEEKKNNSLSYKITDISVASDFKPSKIQGADIAPDFKVDYSRNYVQAGFGNYGKWLADANVSGMLDAKNELGVDVHHLSTSGLKKEYPWDSDAHATKAHLYLNSFGDVGKLNIDAGFHLDRYNYYGAYESDVQPTADTDLTQSITSFGVNAYYDFYRNNILNNIKAETSYLKDHFNTTESLYALDLMLSKHSLVLDAENDFNLNIDLGAGIQGATTKFGILQENHSIDFLTNLTPELSFHLGKHYLKVGTRFSYLKTTHEQNQSPIGPHQPSGRHQTESQDLHWFPRAELYIAAKEEVNFYAGVDGGIHLNTYKALLEENPYLVSDLNLKPTETKYHIYFGIKGDINQQLKYDISGGFSKINNLLFFKSNNLFSQGGTTVVGAYNYLNSYGVTYDNGKVSEAKVKLMYFPLENLDLSGTLKYASYTLDHMENAYYKPVLQLVLGAKYALLDKKLNLGFKGIFVTDRTANAYQVATPVVNPISTTENQDAKVPGYIDLNLSASYKLHKNISVFVMGNNLTGKSYENYLGYKVLGAQVLGGVRLEF